VPVTLWHSRTSAEAPSPFEGQLLGLGVGFQPHGEVGHEAHAQFRRVEHRPVARDHARRLQRLHPAQRGRGAERHAFGQGQVADPPVAGQLAQYLAVFFVNVRHLLRILIQPPQIAISCRPGRVMVAPMTFDMLTGLILFAFASSITPGPNNVMLLASGANFGLRRTVPHMLGISGGHAFMVALVGLGLLGLFAAVPWLRPALTILSVAYFCGWRGRSPTPPRPERRRRRAAR
jgi:hypothetical protein